MPMDPELKAKWIAALRSGEYKQGKNRLHSNEDNSFCCLGVLCEVAGYKKENVNHIPSFGHVDDSGNVYYIPSFGHCAISIPNEFFGFTFKEGVDSPRDKVMAFNDAEGKQHKGFKGLATYIEKHF